MRFGESPRWEAGGFLFASVLMKVKPMRRRGTFRASLVYLAALTVLACRADAEQPVTRSDYSARAGAPYTAEEAVVTTRGGFTLTGTLTLAKGQRAQNRPSIGG